jgi:hypothetical protein
VAITAPIRTARTRGKPIRNGGSFARINFEVVFFKIAFQGPAPSDHIASAQSTRRWRNQNLCKMLNI